jgi:hypothetical protein
MVGWPLTPIGPGNGKYSALGAAGITRMITLGNGIAVPDR